MLPLILSGLVDTEELVMGVMNGNYAVGDLKGNGRLAVLVSGSGAFFGLQLLDPGRRVPHEFLMGAWYADTGFPLPSWPRLIEDMPLLNGQSVADIDGDGMPEVIAGSPGHYVHAYDYFGREPAGWPKFTGGWVAATPAVGDVDGDGYLEVAVTTREGDLFVWDTPGPADGNIQWSSFAHDPRNTGNYGSRLPEQEGPPPPDDDTVDDDVDDDDTGDDDTGDEEIGDDDTDDDDDAAPAGDDDDDGCCCG